MTLVFDLPLKNMPVNVQRVKKEEKVYTLKLGFANRLGYDNLSVAIVDMGVKEFNKEFIKDLKK